MHPFFKNEQVQFPELAEVKHNIATLRSSVSALLSAECQSGRNFFDCTIILPT
jgi:hypothetical protein